MSSSGGGQPRALADAVAAKDQRIAGLEGELRDNQIRYLNASERGDGMRARIAELERAARLFKSNVAALLSMARRECIESAGVTNVRAVEETGEALGKVLGDGEVRR